MTEVALPDGSIATFPDDMAPDAIAAVLDQHFAPRSQASDLVGAVGTGVIKGGADVAGMPGGLIEAGKRVAESNLKRDGSGIVDTLSNIIPGYKEALAARFPWLLKPEAGMFGGSLLPTSRDILAKVEDVGGPLPKPETTAGRYVERGTQWATGSAAMGPGKLVGAVTGAIGGAAAEGAKDVGLPPVAQDVVGMGAQLVAGIPAAMRSTPGTMVRDATRDVTPDDWQRAIAMQQSGVREGVPVLAPQAFGPEGAPLQSLASDTMASRGGGTVMKQGLKEQERAATARAQAMTSHLGTAATPDQMAGRADDAATAVQRQAEQYRTAQAQPFYERASREAMPAQDAQAIVHQVDRALTQVAPNGPTARALRQFRAGLFDENDQLVTNIGRLDSLRKDWRDRVELPPVAAEAISKETAAMVNPILADLRNRMTGASGNYEAGLRAYQWNTPAVTAIENSKVGRLVGTRDPQQVIATFTDPAKVRPADIRDLSLRLNAVDREAFPQMVRTHVENALNKSLKPRRGDAPIPLADFATAIRGGEGQIQRGNWEAMLEGVAQANNVNPAGMRRGWDNLMAVLERTDRIPGTGSQTAVRMASNEAAGRGVSQAALATVNITQGSAIGYLQRLNRDYLQRGNYRALADLFTDPDGVRRLRDLSLVAPNSARAQIMAAELLGLSRAAQGEQ